jgi:hypothetical protein
LSSKEGNPMPTVTLEVGLGNHLTHHYMYM